MDYKFFQKYKHTQFNRFLQRAFGIRTVKTAFATSLAIYIGYLLNLTSPIMAGLAAIVTMSSSIFESYEASFNRMLSTAVGIIIASIFHYLGFLGFFPMVLGIIMVINICNLFKWHNATNLACMVFVIVMIHRPSYPNYLTYYQYGINRLLDTGVGLVIGFLVNYIVFPPNRSAFILKTYEKSLFESERAILDLLKGEEIKLGDLAEDINALNIELQYIEKDSKLGAKIDLTTNDLVKMNSMFFTVFGIIAQFSDGGKIPEISPENMESLNNYFGSSLRVKETDSKEDFKISFNYYLDDLITLMEELRTGIDSLRNILEKK